MRLTAESEIPIFQYSDGAAGGARGRARAEEGVEEGAPEDVGADALRGPPCSAHLSGKLLISPARINHRSLPSGPLVEVWAASTAHEKTPTSEQFQITQ